MKKMLLFICLIFLIAPVMVKANIMCNDGTISKSCTDCHPGCYSYHGGCANNYDSSSYDEEDYDDEDYDEDYADEDDTSGLGFIFIFVMVIAAFIGISFSSKK